MKTLPRELINSLVEIKPIPGILVVQRWFKKECYIYPCVDPMAKLLEILREIRNGVYKNKEFEKHVDQLDFIIYDSYLEDYAHRLVATYVKYYYLERDWKILNKKVYSRNIVRTTTGYDHTGTTRVFVELHNQNSSNIRVVGVFENMELATEFRNKYYPVWKRKNRRAVPKIITPVVACNELTKQYSIWVEENTNKYRIPVNI